MDDRQFDAFSRALAGGETRRTVLQRLAAAGLAIAAPLLAMHNAEAKRRKKKGKKRRKQENTIPQPACPSCPAGKQCVSGACVTPCQNGACGACQTCQAGACVTEANGTACDTSNLCAISTCQSGACTVQEQHTCFPSDNVCLQATCNPATGFCEDAPRAEGYPCDTAEICMFTHGNCDGAGSCVSNPISCSDSRAQCCPSGAFVGQCRRKSGEDCGGNGQCCSDNCFFGSCS